MLENGPYQQPLPRNLVTSAGIVRCRFDLFIRWPEDAGRRINPITRRGDAFGITEPEKMLCSLLRYFIKDHQKWVLAELYDNIHPLNDCERLVLELKGGKIVTNRLHHYEAMLQHFPMPDWLRTPAGR